MPVEHYSSSWTSCWILFGYVVSTCKNHIVHLQAILINNIYYEINFSKIITELSTSPPFYNTIHYNTVLDITQFKDGTQKCIDYKEKWP